MSRMRGQLTGVAKAVFAGVTGGLGVLGSYLVNDTPLSSVTAGQWVYVALTALTLAGGVYSIPNRQPPA